MALCFPSIDTISDDDLTTCFYFFDIFKYGAYEDDTGIHVPMNLTDVNTAWELSLSLIENLTINQIIQYTPSANETLEECSLRMREENEIQSNLNATECNKHINISKYVSNYYMCYRFSFPKIRGIPDTILIASDVYEAFLIHSISFNEALFSNVSFFGVLMNDHNYLPLREFLTMTLIFRSYRSDMNIFGANMFAIRYYRSMTTNLEPPYVTMCKNYSYMDCLTECIQEGTYSRFNRLSPISFNDKGNEKLMTAALLNADRSKVPIYFDIVSSCKQKCPWDQCEYVVTIASVEEQMAWELFRIYVSLQKTASTIVIHVPKMSFIDYMTFVASCFGTWFGVSFIGMNPFKFQLTLRKPNAVARQPNHVRMHHNCIQASLLRLLLQRMKQHQEWMVQIDRKIGLIGRRR